MNSSLISILGIVVLIVLAVLFSNNRRAIKLQTVAGAFIIQFVIGALILYFPPGQKALQALSNGVGNVLSYGEQGIAFLFGNLVNVESVGFVFALKVLPMIIFFSALVSVLYYIGVMQWVVRIIGGGLQALLGTSKAESMSAAANIFVGQTEAPLLVKPFVKNMTQSELFAVMCGGLASIAGSVLAGYASMGVPLPYLLAASFMAAPGGLLFAKLLFPETEKPTEMADAELATDPNEEATNVLDAAATGASTGMKMAVNVGAMLLAFIALIGLLNGILGGIGNWFNIQGLSLEFLLGKLFAPLAWVIGTPWSEAQYVGSLIGQKIVVNEFVAFANYTGDMANQAIELTEKSKAIVAFALCGFANFSSIAILVGGLGVMAPTRRKDVARMGLKAVVAGSLSNLMSAAIAGLFIGLSNAGALAVIH